MQMVFYVEESLCSVQNGCTLCAFYGDRQRHSSFLVKHQRSQCPILFPEKTNRFPSCDKSNGRLLSICEMHISSVRDDILYYLNNYCFSLLYIACTTSACYHHQKFGIASANGAMHRWSAACGRSHSPLAYSIHNPQ